jgi:hypothetical protein
MEFAMKFLKQFDAKLMSWFGGVDDQGKPKLHPIRMAVGNVFMVAYLIYRMRDLAWGRSIDLADIDVFVFLPLHGLYSVRAWRRYENGIKARQLRQLFRPITIAPAVIVPPGMQMPPKPLERVKVAVRRIRGANT